MANTTLHKNKISREDLLSFYNTPIPQIGDRIQILETTNVVESGEVFNVKGVHRTSQGVFIKLQEIKDRLPLYLHDEETVENTTKIRILNPKNFNSPPQSLLEKGDFIMVENTPSPLYVLKQDNHIVETLSLHPLGLDIKKINLNERKHKLLKENLKFMTTLK